VIRIGTETGFTSYFTGGGNVTTIGGGGMVGGSATLPGGGVLPQDFDSPVTAFSLSNAASLPVQSNYGFLIGNFDFGFEITTVVPEPSRSVLLIAGAVGVVLRRRRG